MHISIEEDKVEQALPDDGILLEYPFRAAKQGRYEIWNRIGFEFVRSPFEWRLDDEAWQPASPDDLTTDLMELATWCEVAWLKLGNVELTAGDHRLQIRLAKRKDDQGRWQRVLYASDAVCLSLGPFQPNSKFKPNETGRDSADEAAANVVFQLPEAKYSVRSSVKLAGIWEVARDDEQLPGAVDAPLQDLPTQTGLARDPCTQRQEQGARGLDLCTSIVVPHTQYRSPVSMAGRAYYLDFPYNNLNTTVYVNGVYCGFEKNPFVPFQVDVTKGIKAGQVNEIWVGIRDAWYGRSADPKRPLKLRKTFNIPLDFFHQGFQDLDYPVWNCPQSGILATPSFFAAGSNVYTTDVFVKPSVAQQRLEADVTIANTTPNGMKGEIRWEAVDDATGKVAHSFRKPDLSGRRRPGQHVDAGRFLDRPATLVARLAPSVPLANHSAARRQTDRHARDTVWLSRMAKRRH